MPETAMDALGTEDADMVDPSAPEIWHDLSDDELEIRISMSHC